MRYLSLFLITIFLASCGNQKMRFVRTQSNKQTVVELDDVSSMKKKVESTSSSETTESIPSSTGAVAVTDERVSDAERNFPPVTSSEEIEVIDIPLNNLPETTEDSTTVSQVEADEITASALRAEKQGTWSLILSILFFGFLILAFILLLAAILGEFGIIAAIGTIILSLLALASLITGFILGIKSLRGRYNTPQGRRRAIAGVIIASIGMFLLLLNFALGF